MDKVFFTIFIFLFAKFQATAQPDKEYANEIKQTTTAFINTLTPIQKRTALLSFNDTARVKWNNLPVGLRARVGVSIGNMIIEQRKLLHRILSVSLSSQGYLKATSIMHLDNLLNIYYDSLYYGKVINDTIYTMVRELQWGHRNYFFAIFGEPGNANWGYKLEGHHLSVNFSFVGDKLSITPLFVGTDPAEYSINEYAGWRVLGQEEDLGIKLIHLLSADKQKKAIISDDVPGDIITGAESGKRLLDYQGIPAAQMTSYQKEVLKYIIREFVFNLEYGKATEEYNKIINAGVDKIYFAWIGKMEEAKAHYYVLNGPTFIIEFDNAGFGKNANHIHAIWREKGKEFGEDVLKKHYQSEKH
jgi:hypothetical protein